MLIRLLNANDLIGCGGGKLTSANEIHARCTEAQWRGVQRCAEMHRGV